MSSTTYFISDIHFGAESDKKESAKRQLLSQFLDSIKYGDNRLIIIGDLFDFWFEYKTVIQKEHVKVVTLLQDAIFHGLEIEYIAGNHDFWVGSFLAETIGLKIYYDPITLLIDGKSFYLNHGDGLAKNDRGYRLMKRVFRFKPNIWLYRWLHPDVGVPFAKRISGTSRKYSSSIDLHDEDDYLTHAKKAVENGADYVLMGHRHNPVRHEFSKDKIYINTGDWIHHFSYAIYEDGELSLNSFKEEFERIIHD